MNNIKINKAETIFEPFWDSGESYPNHQKYSRLTPYDLSFGENSKACVFWAGVKIEVAKGECVKLKRKCNLNVSSYDIFRMFASISSSIRIKIKCIIDGVSKEILDVFGKNITGEYDAEISGNKISEYELEFINESDDKALGDLYWLGLSNSKLQAEYENEDNGYSTEWEGCFEENVAEIKPTLGIFFDYEKLLKIREKVKKKPYSVIFEDIKQRANLHMNDEPEKFIGELAPYINRNLIRDRDMKKPEYCKYMEDIAFVGLVENNMNMLKMSCRMALSMACCGDWCESIMGTFPGTTWHHRSFTEERIGVACIKVLDWAGSLLTWHGKNIIYDAIIMKALPRLDADVKTVDYIWYMNQGVFFAGGLVAILAGLSKRYPRYESRFKEAENNLVEMWNNYVLDDGGCAEGPAYWQDSFRSMIISMYIIARHKNMSIKECFPEIACKSENYARCMLSDINDGFSFLPINDTGSFGKYHPLIPIFFSQVSNNSIWKKMSDDLVGNTGLPYGAEIIIISNDNNASYDECDNNFINLNSVGHTMIKQYAEYNRNVHLHIVGGGYVTFGHSHSDKGSFILEVNREPIFIDCGVCNYSNPNTKKYAEPRMHNLIMPDIEGVLQDISENKKIGEILCAEYKDGVFKYSTDLKTAWGKGIFKKNIRSISSENVGVFNIVDEIEYYSECSSIFTLNTYGNVEVKDNKIYVMCKGITVIINPISWIPKKVSVQKIKDGIGNEVKNVAISTVKSISQVLVTEIKIVGL